MDTTDKRIIVRKGMLLFLAALMLAPVLGACGGAEPPGKVTLSKTLSAADGSVSINTPEDWSDYPGELSQNMVMSVYDNNGAFAQVFYYPDDGSGYTVDDYLELIQGYYGDNVIGDVQETKVDDHDTRFFEYSMVDEGDDGNEYNYHGYEYIVAFGADIVEVDIFVSQGKLEGKIFTPSDEQLSLLRSIAETVKVNK